MAKESRLAEIFRQELKKDKGLMAAFLTGAGERAKEKSDFRNYLPKSGITGAITERMFGKPYRAGSKDSKVERTGDISSSKYIPGMAKDMNLMRLNMQKMVTIWGGKPSKSVSTNMLKGKETKIKEDDKSSGIMGGIMGGLGSIGGGLLGVLGSLGGGLLSLGGSMISGIATLIGGIGGGLFSIVGGALSAIGPLGLLLAAGAGFLIYGLSQSLDFDKLKKDFDKIYEDISKSVKTFFGISDKESSGMSITEQFAKKLDKFFGTSKFTDSLNFIKNTFEDLTGRIGDEVSVAMEIIQDIFAAMGKDSLGYLKNFYEENRTLMFAAAGAGLGQGLNSSGRASGAAAPAAAGGAAGGIIKGTLGAMAGGIKNAGGALLSSAIGAGAGALIAEMTKDMTKEELEYAISANEKDLANKKRLYTSPNIGAGDRGKQIKVLEELLSQQKTRLEDLNSRTGNIQKAIGGAAKKRTERIEAGKAERQFMDDPENPGGPKILKIESGSVTDDLLNKKFSDMSEKEKRIFLEAQAQAEGYYPGSLSYKNNNPGNMEWTERNAAWIKSLGGEKGEGNSTHTFAKFSTLEAGYAAMRANWETSRYKNITVAEGLKKWDPGSVGETYRNNIAAFINKSGGTASVVESGAKPQILTPSPNNKLNPNNKEETKVASYYDQMVALLSALIETTSGTTAAVGAAASATQKSNTKMESPYNDELYPLLLQMHASDLASG